MIVRLYNIYGNEKVSDRSHLISDLIFQAQNNNHIDLNTNGLEKRQFLYIDDCCEALFLISQNYDEIMCKINCIDITSFVWTSVKDVASLVGEILNCDFTVCDKSANYLLENTPNNFILDYWKPKINLNEGISKICEILK